MLKIKLRNVIPALLFAGAVAVFLWQAVAFGCECFKGQMNVPVCAFLDAVAFLFAAGTASINFSIFDLGGRGVKDAFSLKHFKTKSGTIAALGAGLLASAFAVGAYMLLPLMHMTGFALSYVTAVVWGYSYFVANTAFTTIASVTDATMPLIPDLSALDDAIRQAAMDLSDESKESGESKE